MVRIIDSDRREVDVLATADFPHFLAEHLETALDRPLRNAMARATWRLLATLALLGAGGVIMAARWTQGVDDRIASAAEDRQIDSLARVIDRDARAAEALVIVSQQLTEIRTLLTRRVVTQAPTTPMRLLAPGLESPR